jgi:hypothetical protein
MSMEKILAFLGAALVLAACSGGDAAAPGPKPSDEPAAPPAPAADPPNAVTFHKDVEPILQKVCQDCHVDGGIAPFSLVTYADAKDMAESIVAKTKAKTMPPWGAQDTSECTPPAKWKNDLRLSDQEIATFAAWHDGGDLEGNPADAPPPRTAPPLTSLAGSRSLAPATPFDLKASKDTFECFVLDPKLTTKQYLTGTNFVPKNKTIVHHALAFAVPANATIPADQYECFGGTNVAGQSLIAAWAPGGVPAEYPADVALPLDAGTKFIVQIHYHPHANATPDPDATAFEYRLTDAAPTYTASPRLIGNFKNPVTAGFGLEPGMDDPQSGVEFVIPANAPAHVETMKFTMPALGTKIWILGVGAHMHLAGRDEKITLTRGGSASCLLQEPAWDFNWQRGYQYDAPVESLPEIAPGDVVEVRCTYDNTMTNTALASALAEAGFSSTKPITLGESTTDEMCIGAFTFVYKSK